MIILVQTASALSVFNLVFSIKKINETNFDPAMTQPNLVTKQQNPPRENWPNKAVSVLFYVLSFYRVFLAT